MENETIPKENTNELQREEKKIENINELTR